MAEIEVSTFLVMVPTVPDEVIVLASPAPAATV